MGIISELRAWWNIGKLKKGDYVGPTRHAFTVPDDIRLSIHFPPGVDDPYAKVVYALRREGQQCYCNLRMLTGLKPKEFKKALRELIDDGRVDKESFPQALDGLDDEMTCFSLRS